MVFASSSSSSKRQASRYEYATTYLIGRITILLPLLLLPRARTHTHIHKTSRGVRLRCSNARIPGSGPAHSSVAVATVPKSRSAAIATNKLRAFLVPETQPAKRHPIGYTNLRAQAKTAFVRPQQTRFSEHLISVISLSINYFPYYILNLNDVRNRDQHLSHHILLRVR